MRWRWNDKLKGERILGDRVVLRALRAGEGVVFARTDAGEVEARFQIQESGSVAKGTGVAPMPPPEEKKGVAQPRPSKREEGSQQASPRAAEKVAGGERSMAEGLVVEKHPNGAKSAEGRMKDGEREGSWTFWDEAGNKIEEGEYRGGKKQGAWKGWDEKGNVATESAFEADRELRHTEISYDDKGRKVRAETVTREGDLETNEVVEWGWHDNGKMMGEKRERNGVRHGEWKLWDEAGEPVMSVIFTNGWALPSPDDIKGPADRKADEIYHGVIAIETNDFSRAAALATGLTHDEQEALSAMAFRALKVMDDDETAKFERLYRLVIDACPETDRAHEAHWRLTNMYQQAFDPPQHEKIVAMLEGFLARYKESKVVSMEKYPAEVLVFSPVRSLHQSYEALKQWDKIAAYYGRLVAENKPLKPVDQFDYAKALDESGNKAGAIDWYQKYISAETDKQSFMLEVAGGRVKELSGQ